MTTLKDAYDRFGAGIFRHAVAICRNQADAEDVVSAVFVKLAVRLEVGTLVHNPKAYLHRITHNECMRLVERRAKSPCLIEHPDDLDLLQVSESHPDTSQVNHALAALPAEQREVCVLHFFEGMSFVDIAAALSISVNTITSRYRYARKKLALLHEPSHDV